jgi:hypothetical protein
MKCSSYTAALNYASPPEADPEFQTAVNGLGDDMEKYYDLFDVYGTDMLTTVQMGARHATSSFISKQSEAKLQGSAHNFKLGLAASVGAVVAATVGEPPNDKGLILGNPKVSKKTFPVYDSGNTPKLVKEFLKQNFLKKTWLSVIGSPRMGDSASTWSKRVDKNPAPISWDKDPICFHPSMSKDTRKQDKCIEALGSYCEGRLMKQGADCLVAKKAECFLDMDCPGDEACSSGHQCVRQPFCKVTLYEAHQYWPADTALQLKTVTAKSDPRGSKIDLMTGAWNTKLLSIRLSEGCKKVAIHYGQLCDKYNHIVEAQYSKNQLPYCGPGRTNADYITVWAKAVNEVPAAAALLEFGHNVSGYPEENGDEGEASSMLSLATQLEGHAGGERSSVMDKAEDGEYLENIGAAMFGYNSLYGQPFSVVQAGTDPGFQHRPLWSTQYTRGGLAEIKHFDAMPTVASNSLLEKGQADTSQDFVYASERRPGALPKVPDGWTVVKAKRTLCNKKFTVSLANSSYDFQKKAKQSLLPAGLAMLAKIGSLAFTFSYEQKEFASYNSKFNFKQAIASAECLKYIATLDMQNPPKTSQGFKDAVDKVVSEMDFYILFDQYGLEFPFKLYFGSKFGFLQRMEESDYKKVQETGLDWKVAVNTAGLTQLAEKATKKILKVEVARGVAGDLTASYKRGTTRKKMEAVKTSFQQTKAFSLGRGLPLETDPAQWMENWVKQVDGEAMPFRYALKSVCEHPALVDKKADCEQYRNTYCPAWLKKNDPSVSCAEPQQSQCTFQSDCPQGYKCEERECVKEPRCRAIVSQYENMKKSLKYWNADYGKEVEVTYSKWPAGYVELAKTGKIGDNGYHDYARSILIHPDCDSVVLISKWDGCQENSKYNEVYSHNEAWPENSTAWSEIPQLPYGVYDQLCKIKLVPKRKGRAVELDEPKWNCPAGCKEPCRDVCTISA